MEIDFAKELNREQLKACTSSAKRLCIIAGAGTGKTRVLTYRLAYLVDRLNIAPSRIVAITFTKKAATELRDRVDKLLYGGDPQVGQRRPYISTIHGFCSYFLRREVSYLPGFDQHFTVADDDEQSRLAKDVIARVQPNANGQEMKKKIDFLLRKISGFKQKGLFPEEVSLESLAFEGEAPLPQDALKKCYIMYQNELRNNDKMDFDDLLLYTYKLLSNFSDIAGRWQHRFDAYLMDEFQDTDEVQYDIVKMLLRTDSYFSVVGDPDQTIYTWRGAKSELITRQIKKDFQNLDIVTLVENYRSTQSILDCANTFIDHNVRRQKKNLVAASGLKGDAVTYNEFHSAESEANFVMNKILSLRAQGYKYSDIAILYRSNYSSATLENALAMNGIPREVCGGLGFYKRREVKLAVLLLKIIVNSKDDVALVSAITQMVNGLGPVGLGHLQKEAEASGHHLLEFISAADKIPGINSKTLDCLKAFCSTLKDGGEQLRKSTSGAEMHKIFDDIFERLGLNAAVRKMETEDQKKDSLAEPNTRINNVREFAYQIELFMDSPHYDEEGNLLENSLDDLLNNIAVQDSSDDLTSQDSVKLMTIHISKGLEFPVVFICSMDDRKFPTFRAVMNGDVEEERRLFYVAMTRAKKLLFISSSGTYFGQPTGPSSFIAEAGLSDAGSAEVSSPSSPWMSRPHPQSYTGASSTPQTSEFAREVMNAKRLMDTRPVRKPKVVFTHLFQVGDRVEHAKYGSGKVVGLTPSAVCVKFEADGSLKNIAKDFAAKMLKKVG